MKPLSRFLMPSIVLSEFQIKDGYPKIMFFKSDVESHMILPEPTNKDSLINFLEEKMTPTRLVSLF